MNFRFLKAVEESLVITMMEMVLPGSRNFKRTFPIIGEWAIFEPMNLLLGKIKSMSRKRFEES